MVAAVKQAIMQCALQLKGKISKVQAAREQRNRKKALEKYIPSAATAIFAVLDTMADNEARGPKRRRLESSTQLLQDVRNGKTSEEALERCLREHVEKIDMDMALEYQMQVGMREGKQVDTYLVPKGARHMYGPELHTDCAVFKLLIG
mmetsp:Transcript_2968/g.8357  ORF Transcript_2968/g.8357 Transcript_2968/m.8357 type:complete len:148 (+) Transcript_2968:278-721(+)